MESTVATAAIGLATTTVIGLIWVVKYFAKTLAHDIKEHTKAAVNQQHASARSAEASQALERTVRKVGEQAEFSAKQAQLSIKNSEEQLKFMKKLNGKLEGAIVQKVTEQTVQHQTVEVKE